LQYENKCRSAHCEVTCEDQICEYKKGKLTAKTKINKKRGEEKKKRNLKSAKKEGEEK